MFKDPAIVHCLELDVRDNFGLGTRGAGKRGECKGLIEANRRGKLSSLKVRYTPLTIGQR